MRTYKHEVLKEMQEKGELDTEIYGRIKADNDRSKRLETVPRDFPVTAEKLVYPEHALKVGSLLYKTSNMNYGI